MKWFMIDEQELATLRSCAKRLFTENRMNGDEMRDMAQLISAVLYNVEQISYMDVHEDPEKP